MTTSITPVDWDAVEAIATRLGAHTRRLVADRDPDLIFAWASRMHRECGGDFNAPTAMTYLELATLVGRPKIDENGQPSHLAAVPDDEENDDDD
jgi:hypothetical protein